MSTRTICTRPHVDAGPNAGWAVMPQLLNAIDAERAAELLADDDWCLQAKADGRRVIVRRDGDRATGFNRRGRAVDLPAAVLAAALATRLDRPDQWVVDGEIVADARLGHVLMAFDLLALDGRDLRRLACERRLAALAELLDGLPAAAGLRLLPTATGARRKWTMFDSLRNARAEGVVFKRNAAPYRPGLATEEGDAVKFKFIESASFIVAALNVGRRSVALSLLATDGLAVEAGSVAIPANHAVPPAGSLVEVRYLYAHAGGGLCQPVYLGPRDDITPGACTTRQLKYKSERIEE